MAIIDKGYLIYDCFSFSNTATVTDLETKVNNLMISLFNFCDAIEGVSADVQSVRTELDSQGNPNFLNAGEQRHCCVNNSNGKMQCESQTRLATFGSAPGKEWFSYATAGLCDKCSTESTGDLTSCTCVGVSCNTYDTSFPNNLCK